METTERDQEIALKYAKGRPATKLAVEFGLSVPTIRRILKQMNAVAGPRERLIEEDKVVCPIHKKLGSRIYAYRFKKTQDVHMTSGLLGWSVKKLRNIEQGKTSPTLQDLQGLAKYMNISLSEIMKDL